MRELTLALQLSLLSNEDEEEEEERGREGGGLHTEEWNGVWIGQNCFFFFSLTNQLLLEAGLARLVILMLTRRDQDCNYKEEELDKDEEEDPG